jgi:hypothetical protein
MKTRSRLVDGLMTLLLVVVALGLTFILIGCYTAPKGEYNINGLQDSNCYGKYGGMHGYCDQIRDNKGVPK